MWHAKGRSEDDESHSSHPVEPSRGDFPESGASAMTASGSDSAAEPAQRTDPVSWGRWAEQLAEVGGPSPLTHFVDTPNTRIELSTTHPGGLARFITGKSTLLSQLIRDDLALRSAKRAAASIAAKGLELATARGIDAVHLGVGIAQWHWEGESFCGPVLMRPLAIRRYGADFELKLRGETFLNPELAVALHKQFSIRLDAAAFAALAEEDGAFKPNTVIDRLRGLTAHVDTFEVHPRLVVSSFAAVSRRMVEDAAECRHTVLDALAGDTAALSTVARNFAPVVPLHPDDRAPETDTLLLDADSEQEDVIAQIAAGSSVVVNTLPGTGGTQTIVNALGALVAQNKRVLVVSPRRSTLAGIARRVTDIGLPGFVVAPSSLRRDLVRAIVRNEKARSAGMNEIDDAMVRLRKVLLDYRAATTRVDPGMGVSVLDCLSELSSLALLPNPPATTARLNRSSVEKLADGRHRAADAMVHAATLGEFKYGPGDSPWYGAEFDTGEQAEHAHQLARRLHEDDLPRLLSRAAELIEGTHMRAFDSVAQLGVYLRLLTDIRDTLDKFQPVVFDRSLGELIAATASRRESSHLSGANRRRLRKLAREYVRPGVHVSDLNEALVRIQQQRVQWQRYAAPGITPQVPVGIASVQVLHQQVSQDLATLDGPLGLSGDERLGYQPIEKLSGWVAGLAAESDALANLQERATLRTRLQDLQLDPLIRDLAERHVPHDQVAAELELSWWRSALEILLDADRALLGANTEVLDRLEADFRLVDEAHAAGSAQLLAWQLAENWKVGLVDRPEEATALKELLRSTSVTSEQFQAAAPHLGRVLAPVWVASPYEVDTITDAIRFDTVVVVDAGATLLAETVGAIRRAPQTVAFGDPITQTPAPFTTRIDDPQREPELPDVDALHADSTLARLNALLPSLELTRSYRAGGEDLAELVNRRYYDGKIESLPWAGTFLGHGSLRIEHVSGGKGMPDPVSGAVESVDAEVERVVRLVMEHAEQRPNESLMVITASPAHSVRVEQAVLAALSGRPRLSEFVLRDVAEPFAVSTIEHAVADSRDHVIFSIGYGRTPHGRVLSDFGSLGRPGGERLVAVAMTRARRSMTIVTCFEPEDLDGSRMAHGATALAEVLAEATERISRESKPDYSDPMLVDLAKRLEVRGLRVALGHRGKLGLVTAHGGMCLAIETDAVLHNSSLRESLRLHPELLRRLGWHYLRVHAFELFSDPDAVADRIVTIVGARPGPITEPIPIQAG